MNDTEETALVVEAEILDDIATSGDSERVAVEVAKEHPRSIEVFRKDLYELATLDQESAETMFYSLKRGKVIEGPSIRFAECVLYAFGNMAVRGRIIDVGATTLVAEGIAWDMERNTRQYRQVSRRITYKNGDRYNQDMITVTENAATSIAIRNVILGSVPRPLYTAAYEAALKTFAGDEKTIKGRREEWATWWTDHEGTLEQMWEWLDIKGPDDIGGFELRRLGGLRNGIREGVTTFQAELDSMAGTLSGEEEADQLDATLTGKK